MTPVGASARLATSTGELDPPSAYVASYAKARAVGHEAADNYIRHTTIGDPELDPVFEELADIPPADLHRFIRAGVEQDDGATLRAAPQALLVFGRAPALRSNDRYRSMQPVGDGRAISVLRTRDAARPVATVMSLAAAALLLMASGTARAETADERSLRGAAADGRVSEVERLLAEGTNPDVPDHDGTTAVHYAALNADRVILTMLLEAGGNPNAVDQQGFVPLHFAAAFEFFEPDSQVAIRVLLDHGADPDRSNNSGQTPLHLAARRHQSDLSIFHLLDAGARANRPDGRGDTPLHYAVSRHSKFSGDVVQALVDRGADGSRVGAEGETPLQRFARVGTNDGRIVAALVHGGADPDEKNPAGESPLHTTIRNGGNAERPRAVEALLDLGADPCIKDAAGYIPYHTAREGGTVHGMLANAGGSDISCESSAAQAVPAQVREFMVDPVEQDMEVTERANVRAGPGTDHAIVDTLDAGTGVRMTGKVRGTDWRRIERPGGAGLAYMHASLLAVSEDHLESVVWERPFCVQANGTFRAVSQRWLDHFGDEPPCEVVMRSEVTSTCDTRNASCDWPCDDAACKEEWTHTPTGSMVEFRRRVQATLEAAGHARAESGAAGPDLAPSRAVAGANTQREAEAPAANAARRCAELADVFASWLHPELLFEDLEWATSILEEYGMPASDVQEYIGNCRPPSLREDPVAVQPNLSEAEGAATVAEEAESTSPDNSNGPPGGTASFDGEPNCVEDTPDGSACWWQPEDRPGCRIWNPAYQAPRQMTWTGTCSDGFAVGDGTLIERRPPSPSGNGDLLLESVGRLVQGKRQGHWVDARDYWSMEGEYVDGRRHGHWVETGKTYAHFEGPYVDGVRHGHWSGRNSIGTFFVDGEFVDGERSGLWVEYASDSDYHSETPYVEGKPHGRARTRTDMGETSQQCFHHGEEIAC